MTPDPLNFLVDLREAAGLSQAEVALRFELKGNQSYKSVAAWEMGKSIPDDKRRDDFIYYLWDMLGLRRDPKKFDLYWETLAEVWHWKPLNDEERTRLKLPLLPQVKGLVHQYRQTDDELGFVKFEEQLTGYLRWVIERTENIELRGVKLRDGSQTTALKLAEVYVTLNAELVGNYRRDKPLERILTTGNRLAVIGGPDHGVDLHGLGAGQCYCGQ